MCPRLWVPRRQPCSSVSPVHSRSSGRFDGGIKGETAVCGLWGLLCVLPAGNSANFCPSTGWLSVPLLLARQRLQPWDFGMPPGVHISQDCGSDIQDTWAIFIRVFSVCCPHCWPFLADSLQAFGVPASSSFSASSESPLPSGSSLTPFLVFCSGQWVAGGKEDAPGP